MKLKGRNIILTGATGGFGQHLVGRLWREGATLLMVTRGAEKIPFPLIDGPNVRNVVDSFFVKTNFLDDTSPAYIMQGAQRQWSHIDGLINNAATLGPVGHTWETTCRAWDDTLRVNLLTPVELCRLVVPSMIEQKHGKIVNLSGGGAAGVRPDYSAYATSKAGLVRFSECLGEELKGTGIDVNCVAPGKMPTGMLPQGEVAFEQTMVEAADLVIFLLSDESNGITGKLISAVWDDWTNPALQQRLREDGDLATLRRIT